MPELTLDEGTHIYRADGVIVPSVTQILEDVGISNYRMLAAGDRERYLHRGRDVHLACQFDDEGDLDEETLAEDLRGYLGAWRRFRKEADFQPSLIEYRGFCARYRYAGQLDRSGSWRGRNGILLDIKTGDLPWWVAIQLAAYAGFFESPASFFRVGVELRANETYRIQEFPCKEFQHDFQIFLAALTVYNEKRRHE